MRSSPGQRFSNVVRSHERGQRTLSKFEGAVSGASIRLQAGESLAAGDIVYQDDTGLAFKASTNDQSTSNVLGLVIAPAQAGDAVDILFDGPMSNSGWAWESGKPVYAALNGGISQFYPSNGYLVVVGLAVAADTILVDVERYPRRIYIKSLFGTLLSIPLSESGISFPQVTVLKDTGEEVSVALDVDELSIVISSNVPMDDHIAILT